MALVFTAVSVIALFGLLFWRGVRQSRYDAIVQKPQDLRRAEDGIPRSLAERDGTGGFL